jgi:thiamine-monophosphate kinase
MFENKQNRTELGSLGEFGLIDLIAKSVELKNKETIKGIGDDAAVISLTAALSEGEGEKVLVATTDMLVEGVHFDLTFQPLKHLGYKSIVVNLSDIYAMNAIPKQVLVSIALSNRFSVEAVEEFYSGIKLACERYGVDLAGGDTTSSTSGLIICVTAIGTADKDQIVYRSGAKEHDLICVNRRFGRSIHRTAAAGAREKNLFGESQNTTRA